jgi:hypothetical protein
MSDQLPAPEFDSHSYERPNQKWVCGHACEGNPCRLGPDNSGRCGATSECVPVLETKPGETKGRYRCTRPGGACETGPLPDGRCCRPIAKCSPVPTLRTRRGRFTRWVVGATLATLLILLGGPWRGRFINPGALSTAHSGLAFKKLSVTQDHFNQNCEACHNAGASGPSGLITAAFQSSPGPFEIEKLAHVKVGDMTALDQSCQKCHTSHLLHQPGVSGHVSCSFCHREHRGAGPMAASTDTHCMLCHGDADAMLTATGKNADAAKTATVAVRGVVRNFATDHPEFRVHTAKLRDSNTLRFNHALHLTGGTIPKLKNGQKLDCRFCHETDATGRYFRPMKFENQCQVCHSLQFDPETPGLTLPHGNPDFVSAFLHSLPRQYADFAARSGMTRSTEQEQFVQDRLQRLRGRVGLGEDFEKRVFFSTASSGPERDVGSVRGNTPALYPGCAYCHEVKADTAGKAQVTRPVISERWLRGAEFNHAKHSTVACAKCHQAEKSKTTSDVILPFKQTCASCHSHTGGAADSCTTCHVYHAGRREAQRR